MSIIKDPTLEQALQTIQTPEQEVGAVGGNISTVEELQTHNTTEQGLDSGQEEVLLVSNLVKDETPSVVDNKAEWTGYGYEPRAVDTDGNKTSGDTASKIVVDKRNNVEVTVD